MKATQHNDIDGDIAEVSPYRSGVSPETCTTLSTGRFRFHVGHVAEGDEGRQVHGGPMVPGPWAYAFGLATVIDNHGGTAREIGDAKAAGLYLEVHDGQAIRVAGHVYEVRFVDGVGSPSPRGEFLKLNGPQAEAGR